MLDMTPKYWLESLRRLRPMQKDGLRLCLKARQGKLKNREKIPYR